MTLTRLDLKLIGEVVEKKLDEKFDTKFDEEFDEKFVTFEGRINNKIASLATKSDLQDMQSHLIDQMDLKIGVFREEMNDGFRNMPTKDEFYNRMDTVLGHYIKTDHELKQKVGI